MLAASVCDTARIPSNDARRDERRPALQDMLDPLAVVGRDHPVADGDIGTDVADPQWIGSPARFVHRADHGAPPTVEARHPPGRSRAAEVGPCLGEIDRPPERRVRLVECVRHRRRTVPAMGIRPFLGHTHIGGRRREHLTDRLAVA